MAFADVKTSWFTTTIYRSRSFTNLPIVQMDGFITRQQFAYVNSKYIFLFEHVQISS